MKKVFKITLWCLTILTVVIAIGAWMTFSSLVKGAASVKKLDEGFYFMEYKGDDGFAELMKGGGGRNSEELAHYVMEFLSKGYYTPPQVSPEPTRHGCSALTVRTPGKGVLMGRNFDFNSATAIVLHTIPDNGYETITTFNVDYLGFGEDWLPEGFTNQYMALSCLFFALDGINEKGLAIADLMAGDEAVTNQDTGKPDLTTSAAICYMLKNAATVDEAVKLLRGIDMHSDIGAAHHYAMADATGKSIVVEYVDNQMVVVDSPVAANHYLCEAKLNVGLTEGDHRYKRMCQYYNDSGGLMDKKQLTEVISSVSQPPRGDQFLGTAWTMVMDLTAPSVTYYSRRNFSRPFEFKLERRQ